MTHRSRCPPTLGLARHSPPDRRPPGLPHVEFKLLESLERCRLELCERVRVVVNARLLPLPQVAHDRVEIRRIDAGRLELLTQLLRVAIELLELPRKLAHVVVGEPAAVV